MAVAIDAAAAAAAAALRGDSATASMGGNAAEAVTDFWGKGKGEGRGGDVDIGLRVEGKGKGVLVALACDFVELTGEVGVGAAFIAALVCVAAKSPDVCVKSV